MVFRIVGAIAAVLLFCAPASAVTMHSVFLGTVDRGIGPGAFHDELDLFGLLSGPFTLQVISDSVTAEIGSVSLTINGRTAGTPSFLSAGGLPLSSPIALPPTAVSDFGFFLYEQDSGDGVRTTGGWLSLHTYSNSPVVTPIPLPAAWAMFLSGLAVLLSYAALNRNIVRLGVAVRANSAIVTHCGGTPAW